MREVVALKLAIVAVYLASFIPPLLMLAEAG